MAALAKWRRRIRREWPELEYLWVIERTRNCVPHVHLVVVGVPFGLEGKTRQASRNRGVMHRHWREVGGGRRGCVIKGAPPGGAPGRATRYVTKYVTKEMGAPRPETLKRRRCWSRTAGFGPDVRMPGWREALPRCDEDGVILEPRPLLRDLRESMPARAPALRPPPDSAQWEIDAAIVSALRVLEACGLLGPVLAEPEVETWAQADLWG
jgi:hypothetical protein